MSILLMWMWGLFSGWGQFLVIPSAHRSEIECRDEVELGYALRAEEWGKGLPTEMATAVLRIGFRHFGLTDVVSFTLPTNKPSRRVMEKVGFAYERNIVYADLPHVLYRIAPSVVDTSRVP